MPVEISEKNKKKNKESKNVLKNKEKRNNKVNDHEKVDDVSCAVPDTPSIIEVAAPSSTISSSPKIKDSVDSTLNGKSKKKNHQKSMTKSQDKPAGKNVDSVSTNNKDSVEHSKNQVQVAFDGLSILSKSGGRLQNQKTLFSSDDRYLFVPIRNQIYVISVATGQIVTIMSNSKESGHADNINSLLLNTANSLQVLSTSLDGTIRSWDAQTFSFLKRWDLGSPILFISPSKSSPHQYYIVLKENCSNNGTSNQITPKSNQSLKKENCVYLYDLKTNDKKFICKLRPDIQDFLVTFDGRFILSTSQKLVHVWDTKTSSHKSHGVGYPISCSAIHPFDYYIAIGDQHGKIQTVNIEEWAVHNRYAFSLLHWHAHGVNSIAYSADGNYLVSGGQEAVLVIWQLSTGHKSFIARLGATISKICISASQSFYATVHSDHSIRLISTSTSSTKEINIGLKEVFEPASAYPFYPSMVIEPRNGYVVVDAAPGDLQFYDGIQGKHVMNLEVNGKMRVGKSTENEIIYTNVRDVAFSPDGLWMATAEGKHMAVGDLGREVVLKFWQFNTVAQKYVLNTRVDDVHKEDLTAIDFQYTGDQLLCVTASTDGKFKIWMLDDSMKEETGVFWKCKSVAYYKDHPALCASFSFDGSVLAIGFGSNITLWNPLTNTFEGVLSAPANVSPVLKIGFFKDSPYIVAKYADKIAVWDLLTLKIRWSQLINGNLFTLQVDTATSRFGVLVHGTRSLYLFDPSSPKPLSKSILTEHCVSFDFCKSDFASSEKTPRLLALTNNREVVFISVAKDKDNDQTKQRITMKNKKKATAAEKENQGLFEAMFGTSGWSQTVSDVPAPSKTKTQRLKITETLLSVLSFPSHTLPEPKNIALSYFDEVLVKNSSSPHSKAIKTKDQLKEASLQQEVGKENMEMDDEVDHNENYLLRKEFNTTFIEEAFKEMNL